MSPNRRIFLNIIATYGRSLYALLIGVFTSRWVLKALGSVDYGLLGVIGGFTAFIAFINNILSVGVGRFFAVSIGKASCSDSHEDGLIECHEWFSTAVVTHLIVASILMAVGYPIGIWAINNFLQIPLDRINDCKLVFMFSCIVCYLSMISVPINAMYTAKQYIAELTIYSFATTTLNALFVYYMASNPGVWLARYAFWACFLGVMPQLIIMVRGLYIFEECKFKLKYAFSRKRIKQLIYYCGWNALGAGGSMLRNQGIQVLVNKYFGPAVNASISITNNINAQSMTLSGAMLGAFSPAIANAYGARDMEKMRSMSYRASKFSMLLILIFTIPLALELKEVLTLWLVKPPPFVYGLTMLVLGVTIVDQASIGQMLAVLAQGKIAFYQAVLGTCLIITFPLAWLFLAIGFNVYYVVVAMLTTTIFCSIGRVLFAKVLVGMSVSLWVHKIVFPILVISVVTAFLGETTKIFMSPSFLRVCTTTLMCEVVFLPLSWFLLLNRTEREYVSSRVRAFINR